MTNNTEQTVEGLGSATAQALDRNTYYVVTWDFEIEESGEVVKDGVVFTSLEPAQDEFSTVFIASIDAEFRARSNPTWSRRIEKYGYITGETSLREVTAEGLVHALQEALSGAGKEISDN